MLESILQELASRLQIWVDLINSTVELYHLIIFFLILLIAWAIQPPLKRLLRLAEQRLADIPWTHKLILVASHILLPLAIRVLGQLGVDLLESAGLNALLLVLINRLVTLWLVYRFAGALFAVNLPPPQAEFWTRRVLLPLILVAGFLHVFGLLDLVWEWGFSLGQRELRITIGSLFFGFITLLIFFVLSRGVRQFLRQVFLPRAGAEPALTQAISTLASYAIIILGVSLAFSAMGFDLTAFAVIAGGLSVGLGFGLQEILNNFISGFILLFERSLGPGDVVRIQDEVGVVQAVGIRSTTIRTRDEIELIVPNSYFLTEIVTNLTRTERLVRVRIPVGVSYSSRPREVEQALLEAASNHPQVLSMPAPRVQFRDFGESSLNFELFTWTDDAAGIPAFSSELRYYIWDALEARGIEIPFPQRDIHLRSGVPWDELARMGKNDGRVEE